VQGNTIFKLIGQETVLLAVRNVHCSKYITAIVQLFVNLANINSKAVYEELRGSN